MQYVATRGHLRNRAVNERILLKQILRTLVFLHVFLTALFPDIASWHILVVTKVKHWVTKYKLIQQQNNCRITWIEILSHNKLSA